jgi:hypothetical protein
MSKIDFASCAVLASLLGSACGGDGGGTQMEIDAGTPLASDGGNRLPDGATSTQSTTNPVMGMSSVVALDGGAPDGSKPATKPPKADPCASPPAHSFGSNVVLIGCYLGCEQGYADCDGDVSNGCEVSLNTPEACQQCHALYCFDPGACGQAAATCQTAKYEQLRVSQSNSSAGRLSGLVAGKQAGQVIATGSPIPKAATNLTLPPVGGALFAATFEPGGGSISWTATQAKSSFSGSNGRVARFGDRLYIIDSKQNEEAGYRSEAILIVTDLDGQLLWNKALGDPMAKLCAHQVAADAQNNVYLAYGVCSDPDFNPPDYVRDGVSYDVDDGSLIVSYDASGTERWTRLAVTDENKVCNNYAESDVLDLATVGDRLFMINEVCLAEIDVSSGKLKAETKLRVEMDDYAQLRADGAGNLYVGSSSSSGDVLLAPSALMSAEDAKKWPGAGAAQVSKYRPDLTHVWTRALAHRGTFGGSSDTDAYFRAFDVTAQGNGMMVGQVGDNITSHPIVVAFDTDGKTTAAAQLEQDYSATQLAFDSAGKPYIGGSTDDGFFIRAVSLE